MRSIRPLDDHVINQIAAGEVVERPLSVVKELAENALDSGADKLDVEIVHGGLTSVVVSDNGSGIVARELPLALQRHCTSKIEKAGQLLSLNTLGFRGEALASIAAVSRLSIISRTADDAHAWELSSCYGDLADIKPAASYPVGSRVRVESLFENTPARRKFQKQSRTEYLQILQYLKQLAFCHDQVEITFIADDKRALKVPKSTSSQTKQRRLQTLFGRDFSQSALALACEELGFKVQGWIGRGDYHRPRADLQFFTLNERVIRDQSLLHAVRLAYDGKIPEGRNPAFALDLRVPASEVDVNVHPTKSQVRFAEPRRIHDQLYSFVCQALQTQAPLLTNAASATRAAPASFANPYSVTRETTVRSDHRSHFVADGSSGKKNYARPPDLFNAGSNAAESFSGFIATDFAFISTTDGVEIIKWVGFLRELCLRRLNDDKRRRPLILPESVDTESLDFFKLNREHLHTLGVVIESIGPDRYALREIPVVLPPLDYADFLRELGVDNQDPLAVKISAAAAKSISVPLDASARQRWFAKLLEQARTVSLDWREFAVQKTPQQWREFLDD